MLPNLEKKLRTHILIEFINTSVSGDAMQFLTEDKNTIMEKHGIIPNVNLYYGCLFNELKNMSPNKNGDYIINSNIFYDIDKCPFSTVYIKIHHEHINSTQIFASGGYSPTQSNTLNEDGKIPLKMIFNIKCDIKYLLNGIKSIFIHELTHAYEDYCRIKNNRQSLSNKIVNSNYKNLKGNWNFNSIEGYIDSICYMFSSMEANAYVQSFMGEMELNIRHCKTSNDVYQLAKNTFIWTQLKRCECGIYKLLETPKLGKEAENEILMYWANATGERFKTFNQLKRIIKGKYLKRCNHMINQISKICYDMYIENGEKNTIPSNMTFNIN